MSYRVVVAVADEAGTRTIDLPPLYESIEPDALDELVERGDSNLVVSFPFAGHEVVVRGDGTVEIG
ncbi:HalOD1 output domain-containing protein [Haladaptatus sp. NG-WS-4]